MRNRFPTHALSRQPWGRDMASRELRMHACQHNVIALSSRWQRALGQNLRTRLSSRNVVRGRLAWRTPARVRGCRIDVVLTWCINWMLATVASLSCQLALLYDEIVGCAMMVDGCGEARETRPTAATSMHVIPRLG